MYIKLFNTTHLQYHPDMANNNSYISSNPLVAVSMNYTGQYSSVTAALRAYIITAGTPPMIMFGESSNKHEKG